MAYRFETRISREQRLVMRKALGMSIEDNDLNDWVRVDFACSINNDQRGQLNNNFGRKTPDHVKAKISESNKGKQIWLGRKHSDAAKAKMSLAKKGKVSPRKGITSWNKGIPHSEESKKKMSDSKKGKKFSLEARQNMSKAYKERPLVSCYKCGKLTTAGNIKRWHGDNCKHGL